MLQLHRNPDHDDQSKRIRVFRQIWDALSRQPVGEPIRDGRGWGYARFSADGEWIATFSGDGIVRVRNARTGQLTAPPISAGPGLQFAARFTPDGQRIVSYGCGFEPGYGMPEPASLCRASRCCTRGWCMMWQRARMDGS